MSEETDTTRVNQADRVLAADILDEVSSLLSDDGIGSVADLIRDGEYDEHSVMGIVRHHRLAQAAPAGDGREAAIARIIRSYCRAGVIQEPFGGPLDSADLAATDIAALTARPDDGQGEVGDVVVMPRHSAVALLNDLNARIDGAHITAVPVFAGIVALHDAVHPPKSTPATGGADRENADEAHRLARVLRIAQAYSDDYGEDMIRAAGMLDRLIYLPAIAQPERDAEVVRLREALGPVLHWYQSDEHDERSLLDIVADIVADLQHDRTLSLQAWKLHFAGASLSMCAQTAGGTAGPDAALMLAIRQWAEADEPFREDIRARAALDTSAATEVGK